MELDQFTDLDRSRNGPPWLKGKAAEIWRLTPLLRVVWEIYSRSSEYDAHVSAVLETLKEAYSILGVRSDTGESPLFMTPEASDNFRAAVDRCRVHISYLEQVAQAEEPPLPLRHMVSKVHSFWHCAFESQFSHSISGRTSLTKTTCNISALSVLQTDTVYRHPGGVRQWRIASPWAKVWSCS